MAVNPDGNWNSIHITWFTLDYRKFKMSDTKNPREYFIRIPKGMFVNKEHFITDVTTKRLDGSDVHVIEYSAYSELLSIVKEMREALDLSSQADVGIRHYSEFQEARDKILARLEKLGIKL